TVLGAVGWDRAALLLVGDEAEGLTGVAFTEEPERGPQPIRAEEAELSALRAALRLGHPLLLPGPAQEAAPLLRRALHGAGAERGGAAIPRLLRGQRRRGHGARLAGGRGLLEPHRRAAHRLLRRGPVRPLHRRVHAAEPARGPDPGGAAGAGRLHPAVVRHAP